MTNYEHYKSEIEKIVRLGWRIAVSKNGKPYACNELNCNDCITDNGDCYQTVSKWADSKYIESEEQVDWSKVPVDTPILVRDNVNHFWDKRHFAEYYDGKVYAFINGATYWTTSDDDIYAWKYVKLSEVE